MSIPSDPGGWSFQPIAAAAQKIKDAAASVAQANAQQTYTPLPQRSAPKLPQQVVAQLPQPTAPPIMSGPPSLGAIAGRVGGAVQAGASWAFPHPAQMLSNEAPVVQHPLNTLKQAVSQAFTPPPPVVAATNWIPQSVGPVPVRSSVQQALSPGSLATMEGAGAGLFSLGKAIGRTAVGMAGANMAQQKAQTELNKTDLPGVVKAPLEFGAGAIGFAAGHSGLNIAKAGANAAARVAGSDVGQQILQGQAGEMTLPGAAGRDTSAIDPVAAEIMGVGQSSKESLNSKLVEIDQRLHSDEPTTVAEHQTLQQERQDVVDQLTKLDNASPTQQALSSDAPLPGARIEELRAQLRQPGLSIPQQDAINGELRQLTDQFGSGGGYSIDQMKALEDQQRVSIRAKELSNEQLIQAIKNNDPNISDENALHQNDYINEAKARGLDVTTTPDHPSSLGNSAADKLLPPLEPVAAARPVTGLEDASIDTLLRAQEYVKDPAVLRSIQSELRYRISQAPQIGGAAGPMNVPRPSATQGTLATAQDDLSRLGRGQTPGNAPLSFADTPLWDAQPVSGDWRATAEKMQQEAAAAKAAGDAAKAEELKQQYDEWVHKLQTISNPSAPNLQFRDEALQGADPVTGKFSIAAARLGDQGQATIDRANNAQLGFDKGQGQQGSQPGLGAFSGDNPPPVSPPLHPSTTRFQMPELDAIKAIGKGVNLAADMTRELLTFGHFGTLLIHNWYTLLTDPKTWLNAAKTYVNAWKDPSVLNANRVGFETAANDLQPGLAKRFQAAGLKITASGGGDVRPTALESVHGIGRAIKGSRSAYEASTEFPRATNALRIAETQQGVNMANGMSRTLTDAQVQKIAGVANHLTGTMSHGSGTGLLSDIFFAPRLLGSQIALAGDVFFTPGVAGDFVRKTVAQSLLEATGATFAANLSTSKGQDLWGPGLGHDIPTDRDSLEALVRNPNFMTFAVAGQPFSAFIPQNAMVKALTKLVLDAANGQGTQAKSDFNNFIQGKFVPPLGIFTGGNAGSWQAWTSAFEPLSIQQTVGGYNTFTKSWEKGAIPSALSGDLKDTVKGVGAFIGGKSPATTTKTQLDDLLSEAGINPQDPNYLIQRRDYLATHDVPGFGQVHDVQVQIKAQRAQLNTKVQTDPTYTLSNFQDDRTKILQQQRDQLGVLLGGASSSVGKGTKQYDWLNSYMNMYTQATDTTSPSGGIDQNKFDQLLADWTNKNGSAALDYVNRYTGAGLGPVEAAYQNDIRSLSADGYFTMAHYQHMKSGMSEADIDKTKAIVHAATDGDSSLSGDFLVAVQKVNKSDNLGLSKAQITDIANSNLTGYENPAFAKYKSTHAKELLWFNPTANWDSYQNYKAPKKAVPVIIR